MELTAILAGRGQRYIGDHVEEYGPGDLVLVGSNLPHTWRSEGSQPHVALVLQFDPDFAGKDFFKLPELRKVGKLFERSARGLHFGHRLSSEVIAQLESLLDQRPLARLAGMLEVLEKLSTGRTMRVLSSPEARSQVREVDETRIAKACTYIETHIEEGVRLDEVSRLVSMSPASFSRYFKNHTGRTFIDYVNDVRIGKACRMLLETDRPITEIAFESGFSNLSNFNRRFKGLKQMTPRSYRQAYRE